MTISSRKSPDALVLHARPRCQTRVRRHAVERDATPFSPEPADCILLGQHLGMIGDIGMAEMGGFLPISLGGPSRACGSKCRECEVSGWERRGRSCRDLLDEPGRRPSRAAEPTRHRLLNAEMTVEGPRAAGAGRAGTAHIVPLGPIGRKEEFAHRDHIADDVSPDRHDSYPCPVGVPSEWLHCSVNR